MAEKTYTPAEIEARIASDGLEGWYLEEGWLKRKYNTDGWPTTLMLVNAIGFLCEAAYHHAISPSPGQDLGQAHDSLRRRHHREGFPPGEEDRGDCPVAARCGRAVRRRHSQQVRSGQDVIGVGEGDAVAHDERFKVLLREFLREFFELFFPTWSGNSISQPRFGCNRN